MEEPLFFGRFAASLQREAELDAAIKLEWLKLLADPHAVVRIRED